MEIQQSAVKMEKNKSERMTKMTYYFYPIRRPWHEHTMPDMVDRIRKEMNLTYTVPVDVISAADHYEITALLPGVKTEDLNVNVVNDTVTIEGKFTANGMRKPNTC